MVTELSKCCEQQLAGVFISLFPGLLMHPAPAMVARIKKERLAAPCCAFVSRQGHKFFGQLQLRQALHLRRFCGHGGRSVISAGLSGIGLDLRCGNSTSEEFVGPRRIRFVGYIPAGKRVGWWPTNHNASGAC